MWFTARFLRESFFSDLLLRQLRKQDPGQNQHAADHALSGKGFSEEKANKLGHVFNVLFPELEESVEANRAILDFFRARG